MPSSNKMFAWLHSENPQGEFVIQPVPCVRNRSDFIGVSHDNSLIRGGVVIRIGLAEALDVVHRRVMRYIVFYITRTSHRLRVYGTLEELVSY